MPLPKNALEVFMIRKNHPDDEKGFWTKIGLAFENKDGSINAYLNAIPAPENGQYAIHLRKPLEEKQEASPANASKDNKAPARKR